MAAFTAPSRLHSTNRCRGCSRRVDDPVDRRTLAPLAVEELVFRLLRSDAAAAMRGAIRSTDTGPITEAMRFIRKQAFRPPSVEGIARQVALNPSQFAHRSGAVARMTPMRFVKEVRLDAARTLLLSEGSRASEGRYVTPDAFAEVVVDKRRKVRAQLCSGRHRDGHGSRQTLVSRLDTIVVSDRRTPIQLGRVLARVTLKDQLHRELDVARQIVLARHLPEIGASRIGIRVRVDDAVERVEELDVRLHAHASAGAHLLHQRDVPQVVEPWTAQPLDPRREIADVVRQLNARVVALLGGIVHAVGLHGRVVEVEAVDVPDRLTGIAGVVGAQRAQVAVEVDVPIVEADRSAALKLTDRLHAPAAGERVGDAVHPLSPPPAAPERQLENP